jgi:predicted Zn finger-like uncharacterized protein
MILTCPACATRYQVDEAKFPPDGRQVRCVKCGHSWHQPGPSPEPEPEEAAPVAPSGPAAAPMAAPLPSEPESIVEPVHPRVYAADPPQTQQAEPGEQIGWGMRVALALGWAALIAMILLIGFAAVRYRQEIALLWPQSAGVYSNLGMKVDSQGIDFD